MNKLSIENLSIDKSDWIKVKFGDIAFEPKESVKDPVSEGIGHVVGLEHIDSEDIHLRRSASIEESTTFTKRFAKGDVLFGRRRAYLKKAAQAEFEGICSGDITVMRAKSNLMPELLPFIVNNEKFFDYAITHSAGGLSPRVKFKDLASYELLLPPKEQQPKITSMFLAHDELLESQHRNLQCSRLFFNVQNNCAVLQGQGNQIEYSEFIKNEKARCWRATTIGELLKEEYIIQIQDGNHGNIHPKSSDYVDDGIPFVMANTLADGEIDFSASKKLPQELTDKLRIGFSMAGDLLLSHKGTVGEVAIVPEDIDWPYLMLTPQVTYYRVNEKKLSTRFLFFVFTSNYFQQQLQRVSSQSTRAYVGITAQRNLKVVIPKTKKDQDHVVELLLSTRQSISGIKEAIRSTKSLQNGLISQVF